MDLKGAATAVEAMTPEEKEALFNTLISRVGDRLSKGDVFMVTVARHNPATPERLDGVAVLPLPLGSPVPAIGSMLQLGLDHLGDDPVPFIVRQVEYAYLQDNKQVVTMVTIIVDDLTEEVAQA